MERITIYSDGAASGNPGPGGYGVVLICGALRKELSAGYRMTTNNRMELLAVIVGLESLKKPGSDATVYSDSKYVINAVNEGWLDKWVKIGFKGKKNPDLWRRFLEVYHKHHVEFVWVKGHADVPENERCDTLAVEAYKGGNLLIDRVFEETIERNSGDQQGEFWQESQTTKKPHTTTRKR